MEREYKNWAAQLIRETDKDKERVTVKKGGNVVTFISLCLFCFCFYDKREQKVGGKSVK